MNSLVAAISGVAVALSGCTDAKSQALPSNSVPASTVRALVPPAAALQFRNAITREATFVFGVSAPVPLLSGQIHQESAWKCDVTARDGGMGCAQFMKATAGWLVTQYPELGAARPYDPVWAFQAQSRLDKFNYARVKGDDECNRWAATLLAYNAGLGIVQGIQRLSPRPGTYWGTTENERYKQSDENFRTSRDYPRRIAYKHQPLYASWGRTVCL